MKTNRFILPLLWREIRRQRLLLFLFLATLITTSQIGVSPTRELDHLSELTRLADLLVVLLTIRVIRSDPPNRELRLLGGKPVPWLAVPLTKGLFIGLFLVLPVWGLRDLLVQQVGMQMRLWDHVSLLIDIATTYGWFLGSTILIALFIRKTWLILILLLVAYLPLQLVSAYADNFWYSPAKNPNDPNLFLLLQCRELVQEWGIALTVIASALTRYRTRHLLLPMGVAVVGLALTLTLSPIWPFNFAGPFANPTPVPPTDAWKYIQMIPVPNQVPPFEASSWPSEDTTVLYRSVQVDGIAPSYYAEPLDYNAVATLHSGEKIVFHNKDFSSSIGGFEGDDQLIAGLVGLTGPNSPTAPSIQKDEFFAYHPSRLHNEDLKGVAIKGTITFQIWRASIFATIPFAMNSGMPIQRGRIQIQKIEQNNGVTADLTLWQLPLTLSGDQIMPWYTGGPNSVLVYNLARREQLEKTDTKDMDYAEGTDTRITSGGNTFITTAHTRYYFTMPTESSDGISTSEWLKGAQMSFVSKEKVGTVDVPYEIDNVDLQK